VDEVKLSLNNFRNEMDEKVLERGWFYFSKGWVQAPKEVLPGFFECVVNEVNPHAVSYSHSDDDIFDDVFCTCGDASLPWCRHLAAVLFFTEDERREMLPPDEHITQ
jgi:hypothetical protein